MGAERYALVTGGGTGIGLGCAQSLVDAGYTVTICGRRADVLETARAQLAGEGAEVRTAVADVTDEDQVAAAVEVARGPQGQLHAVVANAGMGTGAPITLMTADMLRSVFEPNVIGVFNTVKRSAIAMQEAGAGGSIIVVSSIAGALGGRFRAAYACSKAAVDMLVRVSADELGPFQIRVNSVRPGLVPSEATVSIAGPEVVEGPAKEVQDDYIANMPLGRLGTPDDVGSLVAFLAGDGASWITGQNIAVDGGHTIRRAPNMEAALRAAMGDDVVDKLVGPRWGS